MFLRCVAKFLLVLCIVASTCLFGCRGGGRGQRAFHAGMRALEQGRNARSIRLFEQAIEFGLSERQEALAHNGSGLALWRLGERKLSEMAFEMGMDADPTLAAAPYNIGVIRARQGRVSEALAFFRRSALADPGETSALIYLAHLYRQTGEKEAAVQVLKKAIRRSPRSPPIITALAVLALDSGDIHDAMSGFQQALEHDSDYAPAIHNLGVVHERWLGNDDQASAYFEEYAAIASRPPYQEGIGVAREAPGKDMHFVEQEEELPGVRRNADAKVVAPVWLKPGRDEPDMISVEEPVRPSVYDEHMRTGAVLERQGRVEAAVYHYLRACGTAEGAGEPVLRDEALNRALSAAGDVARAQYALGSHFLERKQNAKALEHFRRASDREGNWAAPHMAQAEILIEQGEYDEAAVRLRRADRAQPGEPDALWLLARLYDQRAGLAGKAMQCYTWFIKRFPDDPRAERARERLKALE